MSISSSLNAGIMGLSANASKLAVISDNIANSSTFGYKRSEADFHSMVVQSGNNSYTAGGVRFTSQKIIDEAGSLIGTSNATDIAVRGRGMFPVTSSAAVAAGAADLPFMLQTTGSFNQDADGYLKSATGLTLMGWPADPDGTIPRFPRDGADGLVPVQIQTNQLTAEPTTNMVLGVNLPATGTEPGASGANEVLTLEYFDNFGKSQDLEVTFSPTVPAALPASNEWTMAVRDQAQGGALIGEATLTFQDTATAGGTIDTVAATTGAYDAATGNLTVAASSGPIEMTIGRTGQAGAMTQLSDTFAPGAIQKDGAPPGNIVQVDVDANGMVSALYDTGITRTLYQVPLADVPNPNGLVALDNQAYRPSNVSGAFFLWDAGTGPTGDLVNFAREESTTDVAGELTDLIQTQRAYSSNAKVIQTVDEMLQETTNIKR